MVEHYIGPVLRNIRKGTGFTQEQLAEALSKKLGYKIRQPYISKLELGTTKASLARLQLICSILGRRLSYLIAAAESIQQQDDDSQFG